MAKRTNNDLQNITQKTKDRATRTSLKTDFLDKDSNYPSTGRIKNQLPQPGKIK